MNIENMEKSELKRHKKLLEKIYNEKVDKVFLGTIYQIDLENRNKHFIEFKIGDNNLFCKDYDIEKNIGLASFKNVRDIVYYVSHVGSLTSCNFCIRELITRKRIPFVRYSKAIDKVFLYDGIVRKDTTIPVFMYDKNAIINNNGLIVYFDICSKQVLSSKLDFYLDYHLNAKNYDDSIEYFDARIELDKELEAIYDNAAEDYFKLAETADYSEEHKMKKIKEKYRKYFDGYNSV